MMKKRRLFIALMTTLAALLITCGMAFASNAVVDSYTYTHPTKFSNCIVIDGIDVSVYQAEIDWAKVKRQGIDFAFIRLGYSFQSSPFRMNLDSYFEQNYQAARDAGIMVGVYYYSMATTTSEAKQEANYVLDVLDGRELDLPVVFDYEYAGRVATAFTSGTASAGRTKLTSNALAFLKVIADSDYEPMFYSYRSTMDSTFNTTGYKFNISLIDSKYKVWEAQYSTTNSYARPFSFWQYTSSGKVTGITGNVDCNFWYYDNDEEETVEGTTSIKDATITLGNTAYEYTKYAKKPAVTVTYQGVKLTKGTDYKVSYIKNVLAGTGYAVVQGIGAYSNTQLVPFTISLTNIADGGTVSAIADQTYTGSAIKPSVTVKYKSTTLKSADYTVSYANNTDAGTATVTIKGRRNYSGSFTTTFKINPATPTFTGYSSYSRTTLSPSWTLNAKSSSGASLTYKSGDTSIASVSSSGTVTLKGKAGTVYITVTSPATGNYAAATKQVKITVQKAEATITTDADSYEKHIGDVDTTFSLNAVTDSDGKLTYSSSNTDVASVSTSGKVTLHGNVGTATITISCPATDKYAAATKTVEITVMESENNRLITGVENTTIKASSSAVSGAITVKWTKSAGYKVDYYQVFRSKSKTGFGETPFYTTTSGTKTSYKNTKSLVKGTRYYYKVRGVRTIDGQEYYTQWSNLANRIAR